MQDPKPVALRDRDAAPNVGGCPERGVGGGKIKRQDQCDTPR
jgi:hypothetical protein